ncbi:hypothetical protein K502DRAFT_322634 [Neoconidiobolus thromboides FSU 785]|nr:hypothetical protein K502DRAFT_322634 [Neoconidiobolus thromboides FSU 785]
MATRKHEIDNHMKHLWRVGHAATSISPGLGGYYISLFQKMGIYNENPVTDYLKKQYCQGCGTPILPGVTSNVKVINNKKKKVVEKKNKDKLNENDGDKLNETNEDKQLKVKKEVKTESIFKKREYIFDNPTSRNLKKQKEKRKNEKNNTNLRYPNSNIVSYKCCLCQTNTLIPGSSNKSIEKHSKKGGDSSLNEGNAIHINKKSKIVEVVNDNKVAIKEESIDTTKIEDVRNNGANNKKIRTKVDNLIKNSKIEGKGNNKSNNNNIKNKEDNNANNNKVENKGNDKIKNKGSGLMVSTRKNNKKLPAAKLMNLSKMLKKSKEVEEDKKPSFSLDQFLSNLK